MRTICYNTSHLIFFAFFWSGERGGVSSKTDPPSKVYLLLSCRNRRKIRDWIRERKIRDWIRERIRSMPWPERRVDHVGGQKLPPSVPAAPTDTRNNHEDDVESALLSNGGTSAR